MLSGGHQVSARIGGRRRGHAVTVNVQIGDNVVEGQVLLDIETMRFILEPRAGTVRWIVPLGGPVNIGTVLAQVD